MKFFKITRSLLLWTLILCACSSSISTAETLPARTTSTPTHIQISVTDTPTPDPSSIAQCAYQWAYKDLPELTTQLDAAVKTLIPNSTSRASAFGENCIGNDGQALRFGAMETDFYIIVSVESISEYETFGNWIAQAMQAIQSMPPDLLMGPNPGFVEFRFEKSPSETIGFRVPIQQYNDSANGITGETLFHMFYQSP